MFNYNLKTNFLPFSPIFTFTYNTSLELKLQPGAELLPQPLHLELGLSQPDLCLHESPWSDSRPVPGLGPEGDLRSGSLVLPEAQGKSGPLGRGEVDLDQPPLHHGHVKPGQSDVSLHSTRHGDETKALAAPVIEDDLSVQHSAEPLKELHEVLLPDTQQVTTF